MVTIQRPSAADSATMRLSFSQCSQGGSQACPAPTPGLSKGLSRLGLSSQQAPASQRQQVPLFDGSNMAVDVSCCSQLSQALGTPDVDFITPAEQQSTQGNGGFCALTPAVLSPNRAKRPRNCTSADHGDVQAESSANDQSGDPQHAGMRPPPAKKQAMVVREAPPVCLRNIFASDDPREDDEHNARMHSLPRSTGHGQSRFESQFQVQHMAVLASGSFGAVVRVQHRLLGKEYVIKRSATAIVDQGIRRAWCQEAQAWAHVRPHPNIVRFYDAWMEPAAKPEGAEHCFILLEKCGETVAERVRCGGDPFTEGELLELLRQMASVLASLHGQGMVHMDVKPDNIMVGDDGAFKLGDFGLAARLDGAGGSVTEGDSRYVAREVLNDDRRTLDKADVFSLGASLYELAGNTRLPDSGDSYQAIRDGKLALLPTFSASFQALLAQMLAPKPADRPSAEQILAHPLLNPRRASAPQGAGAVKIEQSQAYGGLNLVKSSR